MIGFGGYPSVPVMLAAVIARLPTAIIEQNAVVGRANRLVPKGEARAHAIALARDIARFPQTCLRADRLSALQQWDLEEEDAIANEMRGGLEVIASGETLSGAARFASGAGRHGTFGAESPKG